MSVAAEYAAAFDMGGRRITLERLVPNAAAVTVENVRARVRGASPEEVASGIKAIERKILLLAADIPDDFLPIRQGDRVLVDGARLVFTSRPDDQTHRDGEMLLAIDGFATGG